MKAFLTSLLLFSSSLFAVPVIDDSDFTMPNLRYGSPAQTFYIKLNGVTDYNITNLKITPSTYFSIANGDTNTSICEKKEYNNTLPTECYLKVTYNVSGVGNPGLGNTIDVNSTLEVKSILSDGTGGNQFARLDLNASIMNEKPEYYNSRSWWNGTYWRIHQYDVTIEGDGSDRDTGDSAFSDWKTQYVTNGNVSEQDQGFYNADLIIYIPPKSDVTYPVISNTNQVEFYYDPNASNVVDGAKDGDNSKVDNTTGYPRCVDHPRYNPVTREVTLVDNDSCVVFYKYESIAGNSIGDHIANEKVPFRSNSGSTDLLADNDRHIRMRALTYNKLREYKPTGGKTMEYSDRNGYPAAQFGDPASGSSATLKMTASREDITIFVRTHEYGVTGNACQVYGIQNKGGKDIADIQATWTKNDKNLFKISDMDKNGVALTGRDANTTYLDKTNHLINYQLNNSQSIGGLINGHKREFMICFEGNSSRAVVGEYYEAVIELQYNPTITMTFPVTVKAPIPISDYTKWFIFAGFLIIALIFIKKREMIINRFKR